MAVNREGKLMDIESIELYGIFEGTFGKEKA